MVVKASTYGAVGNGSTDDTTALQNAINAAQAAKDLLELDPAKNYKITSPLIVQQGGASQQEFSMDGKGSNIINHGSGFAIEVRTNGSITNYATGAGSIHMRNFDVRPPTPGSANTKKGIKVGRTGYQMYDNATANLLQDVNLYQLGGRALEIINAAHFNLERVVQRNDRVGNGEGMYIGALDSGAFCGDIVFITCQFQGDFGASYGRPFHITGWGATSARAQTRGLRFRECTFYGGGARIEASANSQLGDMWFYNCQWDGPTGGRTAGVGNGLEITANNNGGIDKLYLDNPYIVNYDGIGLRIWDDAPSVMSDVHISRGSVSMCYEPIKCDGANGFYLDGVAVTNCNNPQWALINLTPGCKNFKVDGCTESGNTGTGKKFIAVGDGSTSNFDISNNTSYSAGFDVLYDYTGGVTKNVYNNVDV